MQIIQNLFHCKADNVGDRMCGPAQYIWPEISVSLPLKVPAKPSQNLLLGGGQIFDQALEISKAIREKSHSTRVVVWGTGLPPLGKRRNDIKELLELTNLVGSRDYSYRDILRFVPCASCCSTLFDNIPSPTTAVVAFLHKRKGFQLNLPASIPRMTNRMSDPRMVIDFIASGETVITSSYHGVYWAQLLERRVICVPYSEKFFTFQHSPTYTSPLDWRSSISRAHRAPQVLEEYRKINKSFAESALDVWH